MQELDKCPQLLESIPSACSPAQVTANYLLKIVALVNQDKETLTPIAMKALSEILDQQDSERIPVKKLNSKRSLERLCRDMGCPKLKSKVLREIVENIAGQNALFKKFKSSVKLCELYPCLDENEKMYEIFFDTVRLYLSSQKSSHN